MEKIDKTRNVERPNVLVADNTSSLDYLAFSLEYSRRVQLWKYYGGRRGYLGFD